MAVTDTDADERAIRTLTARFADVVNRAASAELPDLFTDDGVWALPAPLGDIKGGAAIAAKLDVLLGHHQRLVQMVFSGVVVPQGETAAARWYISEVMVEPDGASKQIFGVYEDELTRTPAGWRFSRRAYRPLIRLLPNENTAHPWQPDELIP
jgi:ketosteroid isomerase-like protein